MRLAIAALARTTFDLAAAAEMAGAAVAAARTVDPELRGDATLLTDVDSIRSASTAWTGDDLDALVVVQATFADSTLAAAAAASTTAPVVLWAAPEPRVGGRLRRNSLCGINLGAYRLRREGRAYRHLHFDPARAHAAEALRAAVEAGPPPLPPIGGPAAVASPSAAAHAAVDRLRRTRIGVVGERPPGFEPCDFDADTARAATGVEIEGMPLPHLFAAAQAAPPAAVDDATRTVAQRLDLEPLGGEPIEPSVRIHLGLRRAVEEHGWEAVATRCWPECFTEMGGAACTAQALLGSELGVPALCEADAYGAITALLLQWLAATDPFVADLVDLDPGTDTAVVWHCGLAPFSMAATPPTATRHANRGLPLLSEFALRPGVVTIARLSQSRDTTRLTLGRGELLDAPRPFHGTSGTLRFSRPVDEVLATIMAEGLEHHYGIVHGDVHDDLLGVATLLGLPVVAL